MEAHCASETALSLGARPCSYMLDTAFNEQAAFACTHTRARHSMLSLGRRRSTRACGVRVPRRTDWSWSVPHGSALRKRDGLLPRRTNAL